MRPEEAMGHLNKAVDDIAMAQQGVELHPLVQACHQVAQNIRAHAARAGHGISVRVVERGSSVRMTVRGQQATRYRTLASQMLERQMPDAKAEIRAQITRKAR